MKKHTLTDMRAHPCCAVPFYQCVMWSNGRHQCKSIFSKCLQDASTYDMLNAAQWNSNVSYLCIMLHYHKRDMNVTYRAMFWIVVGTFCMKCACFYALAESADWRAWLSYAASVWCFFMNTVKLVSCYFSNKHYKHFSFFVIAIRHGRKNAV